MPNKHTPFWLSLLNFSKDADRRMRLWNGYLGWKLPADVRDPPSPDSGWRRLFVPPPEGGWPQLTEEERQELDSLAYTHGGHPTLADTYMDLSEQVFSDKVDLSGLTIVLVRFDRARFEDGLKLDSRTQFFGNSSFQHATFDRDVSFLETCFHAPVSFGRSHFVGGPSFFDVAFLGGASFSNTQFAGEAMFNGSKFKEDYFPKNIIHPILVDFRSAKFAEGASFRDVQFGGDEEPQSRRVWPQRRVDFTDAEFGAATTFRGAIFADVPAFFNTALHEDTDFGRVVWKEAKANNASVDYAVRAWERLELIMSRLEKPLDRHRFYRLKMRARRKADGHFLRLLNWLFEKTSDYGWGIGRAFCCWLSHWLIAGLILFGSAGSGATRAEWVKLLLAALGTSFANAHAFLFLASDGGYLEAERKIVETQDKFGVLVPLATVEAVLGPIFLFLLLLTLRNRFRLA